MAKGRKPVVYTVMLGEKFQTNARRAKRLLNLAKANAARKVRGADLYGKVAIDLADNWNEFAAELDRLIETGHFGLLPAITENGIPIGASKHFTLHGWSATITLDVPKKVALLYALEPDEGTRTRLNVLTGGEVGY